MRGLTCHCEASAFARREGRSQRRGAGKKGCFCTGAPEQGQWGTVRAAGDQSRASPHRERAKPTGTAACRRGLGGEIHRENKSKVSSQENDKRSHG